MYKEIKTDTDGTFIVPCQICEIELRADKLVHYTIIDGVQIKAYHGHTDCITKLDDLVKNGIINGDTGCNINIIRNFINN